MGLDCFEETDRILRPVGRIVAERLVRLHLSSQMRRRRVPLGQMSEAVGPGSGAQLGEVRLGDSSVRYWYMSWGRCLLLLPVSLALGRFGGADSGWIASQWSRGGESWSSLLYGGLHGCLVKNNNVWCWVAR